MTGKRGSWAYAMPPSTEPSTTQRPRVLRWPCAGGCGTEVGHPGSACYRCRNTKAGATSDGRRTGRTAKMTEADVTEARRMLSRFETRQAIARHFGVSLPTLRRHLEASSSSHPRGATLDP